MKIPLSCLLSGYSGLFQQVVSDVASNRIALEIKVNVHVLAKSGRVIVSVSFGIAEGFQNGIRLNQDIFYAFDFVLSL